MQTDKGVVLATALVQELRREKVVLPPVNVIERVCALAITRANRKIYLILADALNDGHRVLLEGLLRQPTGSTVYLNDRLCRLEQQLEAVDRIAQSGELPALERLTRG